MNSNNPVLNANTFSSQYIRDAGAANNTMTMNGVVNKTVILLILLIGGASYPWYEITVNHNKNMMPLIIGCIIGGFLVAILTNFKPNFSPVTAPIYAVIKGLALGGISALYNEQWQGIALQALMLTVAVLFLMLFLYRTKIIVVTEKFKLVVICATGAIMLLYLVSFGLSFFNISIPFLHGSSWLSIGISLAIIVVAALNLALDFDMIESGSRSGAPKYMEWFGAFALIVTLVWLYLELLRLLSKIKDRG